MGLMHNYVIRCMRVRLGGIAKQVLWRGIRVKNAIGS